MQTELKQLLEEISNYQNNDDIDYDIFNKVNGEINVGAKVEIFWADREQQDYGYIFQLPHQDTDDYDVCIHVPKMDNSDGMGDGDCIFKHLYSVVQLNRVSKIEIVLLPEIEERDKLIKEQQEEIERLRELLKNSIPF